jgi:hypothetical protein
MGHRAASQRSGRQGNTGALALVTSLQDARNPTICIYFPLAQRWLSAVGYPSEHDGR